MRVQRIATGQGQALPDDSAVIKILDDAIFHLLIKRFAGIYPPGCGVVATPAFVLATSHKQGAAGAGAIDNVNRIILVVIHV